MPRTRQPAAEPEAQAPRARNPFATRIVAAIVAVVYGLYGLVGFAIHGIAGYSDPLAAYEVGVVAANPLRTVGLLVVAALGAVALRANAPTPFAWGLVVVFAPLYLLAAPVGMFGEEPWRNILAPNAVDPAIYGITAALAVISLVLWWFTPRGGRAPSRVRRSAWRGQGGSEPAPEAD